MRRPIQQRGSAQESQTLCGEVSEGTAKHVVVEDVRMECCSDGQAMITVQYRDLRRSECLLGWSREVQEAEEPEIWTTIVWANFHEHVIGSPYGLPAECRKEGIMWTG
jgi:hypothetical protein